KFFRHPPQYYVTEILGIELPQEPKSVWKDFTLSNLDRHLVLKESLDKELTEIPVQIPVGIFGDIAKKNLRQEIHQYQQHLQNWGIDPVSISSTDLGVPGGVLYLGA